MICLNYGLTRSCTSVWLIYNRIDFPINVFSVTVWCFDSPAETKYNAWKFLWLKSMWIFQEARAHCFYKTQCAGQWNEQKKTQYLETLILKVQLTLTTYYAKKLQNMEYCECSSQTHPSGACLDIKTIQKLHIGMLNWVLCEWPLRVSSHIMRLGI